MRINKKRIFVAFGSLLILCSVFIWCKSANSVRDYDDIVQSGRLVVLMDSSILGFAEQDDSLFGFQYEIIRQFANENGLEIQVTQENNVRKSFKALKAGEADILLQLIPVNLQMVDSFKYTSALMNTSLVLVQHTDTTLHIYPKKKQQDLANDTVYLSDNILFKKRIESLSDEIADTIKILEISDLNIEQMVDLVSKGKIKNTVCPQEMALALAKKYSNIDIRLQVGFSQNYAWVVNSKSIELQNKLNLFLKDYMSSISYWELRRKYFK